MAGQDVRRRSRCGRSSPGSPRDRLTRELLEPRQRFLDRRGRRQVEDQRLHLRPQEVVGARRAERGQSRVLGGGQEVQHHGRVGEVTDHRPVLAGDATDRRREGGRLGKALGLRQGGVPVEGRTERLGLAVLGDVRRGGVDDPERVLLGLGAGLAPGRDAVAAEDAADRLRVVRLDRGDVEAELEAGPAPRDPDDLVAEDLLGQRLAVRGGGDGDAGVGVQVVDVRGVHQAVHRGVDRRCRAALAVQAEVEGRDHLVLTVHARVDVDQRTHPVEAQHGQTRLGQGAEVAARPLHPEQLHGLAGDRVGLGALGRGVAARVVGVLGVGTEPVRPCDQLGCRRVGSHRGFSSILPACRRCGPPLSAPGNHWPGRPASGPRGGPAARARRRGHVVHRCRTRP